MQPKGSHLTHLTSTTLRQRRPEASRASPQSYKISETTSWIRTRPNLCPTNWTSGFTLGLGKATRVWYGMISTWRCTWGKTSSFLGIGVNLTKGNLGPWKRRPQPLTHFDVGNCTSSEGRKTGKTRHMSNIPATQHQPVRRVYPHPKGVGHTSNTDQFYLWPGLTSKFIGEVFTLQPSPTWSIKTPGVNVPTFPLNRLS